MSITVRYHDLAEAELREASKYYESEVLGLGQTFLSEVDRAVEKIRNYPEAAPIILDIVRQQVLRRFPFSVLYIYDEEGVFILAIANQHRRPFYWHGRL